MTLNTVSATPPKLQPIKNPGDVKVKDLSHPTRQQEIEKAITSIAKAIIDISNDTGNLHLTRKNSRTYFTYLNHLLNIFELPGFQVSDNQGSKFSLHRISSKDKLEQKKIESPTLPSDLKRIASEISTLCHERLPYAQASTKPSPVKNFDREQIGTLKALSAQLAGNLNELLKTPETPFSIIENTEKKQNAFLLYCTFDDRRIESLWQKISAAILAHLKGHIELLNLDNWLSDKHEKYLKKLFGKNVEELFQKIETEKTYRKKAKDLKPADMRRSERNELVAQFRILKFYKERLAEISEGLIAPLSKKIDTQNILQGFKDLIMKKGGATEKEASSLLKGFGEALKIHYIETQLQDKLMEIVKEVFSRHQDDLTGVSRPWSYKEAEDNYKKMMDSSTPAEIVEDWRRAINGCYINFFDPSWTLLVPSIEKLNGEENTPQNRGQALERYIHSLEQLVSTKVFLDPSGAILSDLRKVMVELLPPPVHANEDILDVHERIFRTLSPAIQLMKEKGLEALPQEVQALLGTVSEKLAVKHAELIKKVPLPTIAIYLLNFYRCLYQSMLNATLTTHQELYNLLFGREEEYVVQTINRMGTEEGWIDEHSKQINIVIGLNDITFQYLIRREIGENEGLKTIYGDAPPGKEPYKERACLFNQQVSFQVPSIHSREPDMKIQQLFTYEMSPHLNSIVREKVERVLWGLDLVAKGRGFPPHSLIPFADPEKR